jgi:hypothetical protein
MNSKVLFATPTYDYGFCAEYVTSMIQSTIYLRHHNIDVFARYVGGMCFIDLARNDIVKYFLSTDATDLFFIDADVGWDYKATRRFIEDPHEIVAGLVPKRWEGAPYHDNALTGECEGTLLSTLEAPTAFMRIKRSVFAILDEAYPEYAEYDTLDKGRPYFQTGFTNRNFQGEDIFFCRQWIKLGGKIWIDPDVTFSHRGQKPWQGNYQQYAVEKGILRLAVDESTVSEPESLPLSIAS